jgi:excisionase family DNA binding protein
MLDLVDAAAYAHLSVKTLRRKIAQGHLTAYRVAGGRRLRVRVEDVEALFRRVPTA